MRTLIFVMLAVCVSPSGYAQGTGTIAGRVVDGFDGQGLPGANVIVEGTSFGAATDLNGNYRITDVTMGNYDLTAGFIGYAAVTETGVDVNSGYTRIIDFELEDDTTFYDYEPSCNAYHPYRLVQGDPYAARVVLRSDYCSISLENLPVGR